MTQLELVQTTHDTLFSIRSIGRRGGPMPMEIKLALSVAESAMERVALWVISKGEQR
jgi:hypothetical protein